MCDEMSDLERQISEIADKYLINVYVNEKTSKKSVSLPELKIQDGGGSRIVIENIIDFEKIFLNLIDNNLFIRAILDNENGDRVLAKNYFRTNYISVKYANNILDIASRIGNLNWKLSFDESGWKQI